MINQCKIKKRSERKNMEDTKKLLNDKTIHLLDISNNNDSKCKIERKSLIILKTIIKNICNHLLSITTLKKNFKHYIRI